MDRPYSAPGQERKRGCKTSFKDCMSNCISVTNPWWTVPISGGVTGVGIMASGSIAVGAAWGGVVLGSWALGTSIGCSASCTASPCNYSNPVINNCE